MGSRCYYCGESFGRCYEHPGFPEGCPPGCDWGKHDCSGDPYKEDDE
jgi:hypothetical protein